MISVTQHGVLALRPSPQCTDILVSPLRAFGELALCLLHELLTIGWGICTIPSLARISGFSKQDPYCAGLDRAVTHTCLVMLWVLKMSKSSVF